MTEIWDALRRKKLAHLGCDFLRLVVNFSDYFKFSLHARTTLEEYNPKCKYNVMEFV